MEGVATLRGNNYHYVPVSINETTFKNHQVGGKEYFGRVSMTKNEVVEILKNWYLPCLLTKVNKVTNIPSYLSYSTDELEQLLDDETLNKKELEEEIESIKAQITAHPDKAEILSQEFKKANQEYQLTLEKLSQIDKALDSKYEESIKEPQLEVQEANDVEDVEQDLEDTLTNLVIPEELLDNSDLNASSGFENEELSIEEPSFESAPVIEEPEKTNFETKEFEKQELEEIPVIEPTLGTEEIMEISNEDTVNYKEENIPEEPIYEEDLKSEDETLKDDEIISIPEEEANEVRSIDMTPIEIDLKKYDIKAYSETNQFKESMNGIYENVSQMMQGVDAHYMNAFKTTQESMTREIQNEVLINNDLRQALQAKEEVIVQLKEAIAREDATLTLKNEQIEGLGVKMGQLRKNYEELEDKTKTLQLIIDDKDVKLHSQSEAITNLQGDLETATKLKDAAEAKCEQAEGESSVWERQAIKEGKRSDNLEKRLTKAQDDVKDLRSMAKEYEAQIKKMTKEHSEQQEMIAQQEQTIENQALDFKAKEDEFTKQQQNSNDNIIYLTGVVDSLRADNDTLTETVNMQNETISKLEKQNKDFQVFMSQLAQSPMGEYFKASFQSEEQTKTKVA